MKKLLGGQRFGSDEEVKSVVRRWLYAQKTEFYERGVLKSVTIGEICRETWFQCRRIGKTSSFLVHYFILLTYEIRCHKKLLCRILILHQFIKI